MLPKRTRRKLDAHVVFSKGKHFLLQDRPLIGLANRSIQALYILLLRQLPPHLLQLILKRNLNTVVTGRFKVRQVGRDGLVTIIVRPHRGS